MTAARLMAAATTVAWIAASSAMAQQPARDSSAAPPPSGGVTITGTIVTTEATPQPVRRARVTLNPDSGGGWTTVSDDRGQFVFADVPPGRYDLAAAKAGYVAMAFGARGPGRKGTPIVVTTPAGGNGGGSLAPVTLALPRGAVIAGTIRDDRGRPMSTGRVTVMRSEVRDGERTIVPFGDSVSPDDRGAFRIYGLPAGRYLVRLGGAVTAMQPMNTADVERVRAAVAAAQSGAAAGAADAARVAAIAPSPKLGYAPVYFPGVTDVSLAEWITVAPGDVREGLELVRALVPNASIAATLAGPGGVPITDATVSVTANDPTTLERIGTSLFNHPSADGRFTVDGLAPGTYTITAELRMPPGFGEPASSANASGGRGGGPAPASIYYTSETVTVRGADVSVGLTLRPGARVSGRVASASATPLPAGFPAYPLSLKPPASASGGALLKVQPDNTFVFAGVKPGRYLLAWNPPPDSPWTLSSATLSGQNALDVWIELRPGDDYRDIVVMLTDRPATFTGTLQDASGRSATDYLVIVFPRDPSKWTPAARSIAAIRPGADGRFVTTGLPPGEYHVAAVTDAEPDEWFVREFLEALVPASAPIALTAGGTTRQDLRLGGGSQE